MNLSIIVAGGTGTRMNSDVPKQFLEIKNTPILLLTLQKFYEYDANMPIWIVLHKDWWNYWENICEEYKIKFGKDIPTHFLVNGGNTRIQSVKNALSEIDFFLKSKNILPQTALVSIHDAVRPLVSQNIITQNFVIAKEYKSAVTCVSLKDSLRYADEKENYTVNRALYRLIQTPQTFDFQTLYQAYQSDNIEDLTDDASVWEKAGNKVQLVEGHFKNIKITTPEDLDIAEIWIEKAS